MSVYLFICLSVADGRPNGWADQDKTWHRDYVSLCGLAPLLESIVMWVSLKWPEADHKYLFIALDRGCAS